jgi:hypothetical protein
MHVRERTEPIHKKFFGEPAHSIITAEYLFRLRKALYNGVLINMTLNDTLTLTDSGDLGFTKAICGDVCKYRLSCTA